jgi:hypothetical protein
LRQHAAGPLRCRAAAGQGIKTVISGDKNSDENSDFTVFIDGWAIINGWGILPL